MYRTNRCTTINAPAFFSDQIVKRDAIEHSQLMHHFHQMISGNSVQPGDALNRHQPIAVEAQLHQDA